MVSQIDLSQIDLALGAGTAMVLVLLAALLFRDFRAVPAGRLAAILRWARLPMR